MHRLSPIVLLLLLTACTRQKPAVNDLPFNLKPVWTESIRDNEENIPASSLYNSWRYSNTIFYVEQLIINANGTFSFFTRGCMAKMYTEGKWARDGNSIVLTSLDKYKTKSETIDSSEILVSVVKFKNRRRKTKDSTVFTFSKAFFESKISTEFKLPDTTNIYLDHQLFRFENGFLYRCNSVGNPTEKFYSITVEG